MNIREYEPNDLVQCLHLFIDVFNKEPWNEKWSMDRAELYLQNYINTPGFIGVLSEQDETVDGFIFGVSKPLWSGDEFFINEMCVRTDRHRSGTGTKMLQYLERILIKDGITDIALLTNRNIPAEQFYLKNGFEEISRLVFLAKHID